MKHKTRAALAIGAAVALIAGAAVSAASAVESNGSDQKLYQYNGDTAELVTPGTVVGWTDAALAAPSKTDPLVPFPGSADATGVTIFISNRGEERDPSKYLAYAPGGFNPGTTEVILPTIYPGSLINGNAAGVKAAGGNYSLGFAFTKTNGLAIATAGVVYHHITVTAGTGNYTFEDPTSGPVDPEPPADPTLQGSIDLEATTISAADGNLSLVIPAGAKAVLGAATLVNNVSKSTGTLGDFKVVDGRVVTHPGWTLNAKVDPFVSGANTIPASQLGVAPKLVATTASAVTTTAAQAAGSAVWPTKFAEADNGAAVGETTLNADLTFIAPASAPAGTYTSKMTLTLVSK